MVKYARLLPGNLDRHKAGGQISDTFRLRTHSVVQLTRILLVMIAATVLPIECFPAKTQTTKSGTLRAQKLDAELCEKGCIIICGAWETVAAAVCISDTPMQPHVRPTSDGKFSVAQCGPSKGMTVICVAN